MCTAMLLSTQSVSTGIAGVGYWWFPPNSPQSVNKQPQPWVCRRDSWKSLALHKIAEDTQDFHCLLISEHCNPHTIMHSVLWLLVIPIAWFCIAWIRLTFDLGCQEKSPTASNNLGPSFAEFPLNQMKADCIREDYRTGPLWDSNVKISLLSGVQLFPRNLLYCASQFILLIHCHAHYLSNSIKCVTRRL